jgi:hypothetical protein
LQRAFQKWKFGLKWLFTAKSSVQQNVKVGGFYA